MCSPKKQPEAIVLSTAAACSRKCTRCPGFPQTSDRDRRMILPGLVNRNPVSSKQHGLFTTLCTVFVRYSSPELLCRVPGFRSHRPSLLVCPRYLLLSPAGQKRKLVLDGLRILSAPSEHTWFRVRSTTGTHSSRTRVAFGPTHDLTLPRRLFATSHRDRGRFFSLNGRQLHLTIKICLWF